MKEKLLAAMLFFVTLWGSGCASIVTGKFQNIPVTSEPPGAKVRSDTGVSITTPGIFELVRNQNHILVAEYPGCEPQQKELKHGIQGWFWGNLLFGVVGIIGEVVDVASGACNGLQPKKVHFNFTPEGQAAITRQKEYLNSHPETSEKVRFAILNGLTRKNMTKDEVLASLGKPDMIEEEKRFEVFIYNERTPSRYYLKKGVLKKAK